MTRPAKQHTGIEWPTLGLIALCYGIWAGATGYAETLGLWISVPVVAAALGLHSSLQHEVLHGHPFRSARLNEALVFPALGLAIPYQRFRDTHLTHHRNELLTDPYDDPESNYLDPAVWRGLPEWKRRIFRANNTLLGRMVLGPALGTGAFVAADINAIRRGEAGVLRAWGLHGLGALPVIVWVAASEMPIWAYLLAAYLGLSILKIRTFLEHRADERAAGRSVIIEDRGPLALLFLNNNFHAVHHAHPSVSWYKLPALYHARREIFLRRNGGYRFASYGAVFRDYLLRTKDPVAHPLIDT
jgi:fatty acid desaturase